MPVRYRLDRIDEERQIRSDVAVRGQVQLVRSEGQKPTIENVRDVAQSTEFGFRIRLVEQIDADPADVGGRLGRWATTEARDLPAFARGEITVDARGDNARGASLARRSDSRLRFR